MRVVGGEDHGVQAQMEDIWDLHLFHFRGGGGGRIGVNAERVEGAHVLLTAGVTERGVGGERAREAQQSLPTSPKRNPVSR